MKIKKEIDFEPVYLAVYAEPSYWEDATVNGVDDIDGTLIPLRSGDKWAITIDLPQGKIRHWTHGTTAYVHYKVCDTGTYFLRDGSGREAKYKSDYVPDKLLCHGDRGYGDYIVMDIDADGQIVGFEMPELNGEDWELV